jgi:hypothetical protein
MREWKIIRDECRCLFGTAEERWNIQIGFKWHTKYTEYSTNGRLASKQELNRKNLEDFAAIKLLVLNKTLNGDESRRTIISPTINTLFHYTFNLSNYLQTTINRILHRRHFNEIFLTFITIIHFHSHNSTQKHLVVWYESCLYFLSCFSLLFKLPIMFLICVYEA